MSNRLERLKYSTGEGVFNDCKVWSETVTTVILISFLNYLKYSKLTFNLQIAVLIYEYFALNYMFSCLV